MKSYIKSTGHNKTGALSNSISFNVTYNSGVLDMGLKAKEYILFLDDGKFIDDFFESSSVKSAISDFVVEEFLKDSSL